jgi:hypothetical protein
LDLNGSDAAVVITNNQWSNFPTNNVCRNNLAEDHVLLTTVCSTHISGVDPNVAQSNNTPFKTLAEIDLDDPGNFDYHIGASSAAIEWGDCSVEDNATSPSLDKDDNVRSSTTCDAGAYEF